MIVSTVFSVIVLLSAVLLIYTAPNDNETFTIRAIALVLSLCAVGAHIAGFVSVVPAVLAGISLMFHLRSLLLRF